MSLGKEALIALLKYHDDLYYNQDRPELSDYEYDALKNSYVELYGEYNYVPGEAQFNKIEHSHKILSLDKLQIDDETGIFSELKRLGRTEDGICIEPKFDGLTVVIYPNGKFVTRGNGRIGEDVTLKCMQIPGLNNIKTEETLRAEILMPISEFNKINIERIAEGLEPYKNPRNAAAGMLRNDELSKIKGLKAFIYDNLDAKGTHTEIIKDLEDRYPDMATPLVYYDDYEAAMGFIKEFDRTMLDYEIDGLVIKSDIPNSLEHFGMTGHHPKNAIAIKFTAEGNWTQIHNVTWQVGKTGQICPVAELEPVEIMGSTISRVTLHNSGVMSALGLDVIHHDKNNKTFVHVIKANDVIPKVIGVRHDNPDGMSSYVMVLNNPNTCPECGALTELRNDILFCTGDDCIAQLAGKMQLLASRDALNIEGMSEATIEKIINFYNEYDIKTVEELDFTFPLKIHLEDIACLPGFADKSIEKLYSNIQKAKDTDLNRFIYAANIPLIGRSASEAIANHVRNLGNLIFQADNNFNDIAELPDFGPKMIDSLRKHGKEAFAKLWDAGVRPRDMEPTKPQKVVAEQFTFVITGSFDIPRKEIEEMIKDAGHKKSGSVSSKTSYLLASPGEESTSKYKKASELGVKIINSLEELKELIND